MSKPKVIAFYLPQYHPTPDNDKWWGKGFTEWTNVGKAKPLFPGHYQPKVPADLGYYDLRLPEVREAQAELAKEAGIYGFCYYHYWFGNGKEELELPFNEVLRLGKPDFPFMLCWANESWHKKFWDKDGKGSSKEMLIEQTYPGEKDIIDHFYRLLPAFKDSRYITHDGKPIFMIYNPFDNKNWSQFMTIWNELAVKNGLKGFSFICQIRNNINDEICLKLHKEGFEYVNSMRLWEAFNSNRNIINKIINRIKRIIFNTPLHVDLSKVFKRFWSEQDEKSFMIPTIIPNWDHTPRSGTKGTVFTNSTPEILYEQTKYILSKSFGKPFVFLKSWNEWGEGNYMEPDLVNKKDLILSLEQAIESIVERKI